MTALVATAAVFFAVSLAAGVIAWLARPRPEFVFVEFGEVPSIDVSFAGIDRHGVGDLADASSDPLRGGCTRVASRRPDEALRPAGAFLLGEAH